MKAMLLRVLIGLILIFIGILALTRNQAFIKILVILCGLYMVCYCLLSIFSASAYKVLFDSSRSAKVLSTVSNLLGLVVGIVAIVAPIVWAKAVGSVLAYCIAAYLLFSAVVDIRLYFGLNKSGIDTKNLIIQFLCDLIFAIVLILAPLEVGKTILVIVGMVMIVTGVLICFLSIVFRVRQKKQKDSSSDVEVLN